jgi:hypothetical protein
MENKCIKNVDEETWKDFRDLALKNNMKMSILLKIMVSEFEKNSKDFWKEILSRKTSLTNEEAEDIGNIVKKIRKERGFRNESGL